MKDKDSWSRARISTLENSRRGCGMDLARTKVISTMMANGSIIGLRAVAFSKLAMRSILLVLSKEKSMRVKKLQFDFRMDPCSKDSLRMANPMARDT